ncbi:TIGR03088 family PEP-CTERM/XrtA system glycosyltransferase [Crenothrix sp.]|uniref:TIGR03088 family PEP-CTERM/XrtA system glycosyltransferase n=1 Tax=Crenothrix sp. TaxID=3100433 RepID=UPI00374CCD65
MTAPRTVLHLLYCFDIGGLETVMVNLINTLPNEQFKHVIISLTVANPKMVASLKAKNIEIIELHKSPGNDLKIHYRLWRLFRHHQPDIVHSYNLATLEYQFIAYLAGAPCRLHAEHGRDIYDLDGTNKKYQLLRRFLNPFIHQWITVSEELSNWLINTVKIPGHKVNLIYNGIDLRCYQPVARQHEIFTVGTVGRAAAVKNQLLLIKAIENLLVSSPQLRPKIQLLIVGDGELLPQLQTYIQDHQLQDCVHLLGARRDVAEILKQFDLFVLPSLAEGIALTLLEAMASGLPVIATAVGGNPELIDSGVNGILIPSQHEQLLADSIGYYLDNPHLRQQHGQAGRNKVEKSFSLNTMVKKYLTLYQEHI